MEELIGPVCDISREAGRAILEIYASGDFEVSSKSDASPLTAADLAAHNIIVAGLTELTPDLPVLSEESQQISFERRKTWRRYWLVDPLDGTKEFIGKNGEFTVNIALIEDGAPVLGVVYVPVKDVLYFALQGKTTYARRLENAVLMDIHVRSMRDRELAKQPLTIVASRRHGGEALAGCIERLTDHFPDLGTINMGSSLKICLVASGVADLYPRLAPTCEWDTAAAQAVVEAAGGAIVDINYQPLRYNQKEALLNPFFYVIADRTYSWEKLLTASRH